MTLGFHHSLANVDVAETSAVVVGKNILDDILQLHEQFQPFDPEWEQSVMEAGRFAESLRKVGETAKFLVMTLIIDHWDSLSMTFRERYNYQWAVYVAREIGIKPSTAENYARAIRTFFLQDAAPVGQILVVKTDAISKPVRNKTTGEVETEYVEWDPSAVDITKLVRMRPIVEGGGMTPRFWSLLADKTVTVEALTTAIYTSDDGDNGSSRVKTNPTRVFSLEGDSLICTEFGESAEIATINFEMYETQAGRSGIQHLLRCVGIQMDEDVIAKMAQETHVRILKQVYDVREEREDGNYPDN